MPDMEFSYTGKKIVVKEAHPNATVSVDGRVFKCHHHHAPDDKGLAMWMCDEAYFMSADLKDLAKHFADYGYMFDDPTRVRVDDSGAVIGSGAPSKPPDTGHGGHHDSRGRRRKGGR